MSGGGYVGDSFGLIKNDLGERPEICDEQQLPTQLLHMSDNTVLRNSPSN